MNENKKILLYRIDEQAKNVIFVVTADDEKVWGNISEDMQTVLSFDEIFRNLTAFRDGFPDYEQLTDELIGAINGRGEVFNNIREVMRDDWNFEFNSESDMKAFRVKYDKIIIRGNDRNDIYTVADTALVNFFYDFSFAIHSRKLYVCSCKYCSKVFLGKKNAVCCDGEECQTLYQHDTKNEKRRTKAKDPYNAHMSKLSSYLSQHTSTLKANVQEDMRYVEKFKSRNGEFKDRLRTEIERCIAENIIPGEEQDKFLQKLEAEIVVYQSQIEAEWRTEQEQQK